MKSCLRVLLLLTLAGGSVSKAFAQIERAIDSATTLIGQRRSAEAVQFIEGVLTLYPDAAPLWRVLGQARHQNQQSAEAAAAFEHAWSLEHCDSCYADLEMAGAVSLLANRTDDAKSYFTRAVEHGSEGAKTQLAKLYFRDGEDYSSRGHVKSAIQAFQASLRYRNDSLACQRLLFAYFQDKDYDQVERLSREYLAADPGFLAPKMFLGAVRFERANVLLAEERFGEAVAPLTACLEFSPAHVGALFALGCCYERLGDTTRAIAFYERASGLGSRQPTVYLNLGKLYLREKKFPEAIAAMQKSLRLHDTYVEAWAALSEAYAAVGDDARSTECNREAARFGCVPCWKALAARGEEVSVSPRPSAPEYRKFSWFFQPLIMAPGDTLAPRDTSGAISLKNYGLPDSIIVEEPPKPIRLVAPKYPEVAKSAGLEGRVVLKLLVSADGRVTKALPFSRDESVFLAPAIEAALSMEFTPAKANGLPISTWIIWPVRFRRGH